MLTESSLLRIDLFDSLEVGKMKQLLLNLSANYKFENRLVPSGSRGETRVFHSLFSTILAIKETPAHLPDVSGQRN